VSGPSKLGQASSLREHRGGTLGLGLAALGRPSYINLGHGADVGGDRTVDGMERAAHDVLDAAYAGGIRHVDAARSYGRAEAFLASWLKRRHIAPGELAISSKWGYRYTAGWRVEAEHHEVKELSAAQLRRQWPETQQLLGGYVGLYQIHSATLESGVLDDPEVRAELAALRAAGVRVGLSVTGDGQAATIEHALEVGGFDEVQATWNLHERSAGDALARAHAAGLQVYVKEALANGRLTDRGGNAALAEIARDRGVGADAIALAAVLAQPWAGVVLSGAATVEQLRSNLRARDVVWDAELDERLAGLVEAPSDYWSARGELAWN
jgi:aryl-alcohol dehydrogenase-like predicted oxidoreductase